MSNAVTLSVVVVIVSDTTDKRAEATLLEGCLESLTQQDGAPSMQIVVPHHDEVDGLDAVRARFPQVAFHRVDDLRARPGTGSGREHHDELRARGLALARGELIALMEDHGRADPGWAAAIVRAHANASHAAVGGAMDNGVHTVVNWAVYFCDFGKYQNPLPAGPSWFASDANVSYKRVALESVRDTWAASFNETKVHAAMFERGETIGLDPAIVVYQHRFRLSVGQAVRERFVWGRSFAASRCRLVSGGQRMIYAALSPVLPAILVFRLARTALARGGKVGAFALALPVTVVLEIFWSMGEAVGYVTARA